MKIDVTTLRSLRPEVTGNPKRAYISFEGDDVRFMFDGTNPTATVGHLASAGGSVDLFGADINLFRIISTGVSSIQVTVDHKARDNRYE